MLNNELDYRLSAARAAHAHLVRLHNELTEKFVLEWLRENYRHPKAKVVDTCVTLYRLNGNPQDLRDAEDYVIFATERSTQCDTTSLNSTPRA